ncbi:hypothetical protein AAC387_Pa01g2001 [Persea americana]
MMQAQVQCVRWVQGRRKRRRRRTRGKVMQVALCRVSVGGRRIWGRRKDDAGAGAGAVRAVGAGGSARKEKRKEKERGGDAGGCVQGECGRKKKMGKKRR